MEIKEKNQVNDIILCGKKIYHFKHYIVKMVKNQHIETKLLVKILAWLC